jgi:signal transduction histidine kinase
LGIAAMHERAYLLHGDLDITSEPGHGALVVAWVPLSESKP